MSIPQADLFAQHEALRSDIEAAIRRVIDSSAFIRGPEVAAFEREFAAYIGTRHGVGAGSGTDALVLALKALDLGPDRKSVV